MLMRKFAATSAMVIAALGVTAGTVHADPAPAPAQGVEVSYEVKEKALQISAAGGSVAVEDGLFKIKDANGTVMAGGPLMVQVDDFLFPVAAEISGNTATLTPEIEMDKAVYKPVALPFQDQAGFKNEYEREKAAYSRMKDNISMAATLAGLTTTVLGGIVGCVLGAAVGLAASLPIATMFGAGPVIGCLVGAAATASFVGIVGTILITAPVAVVEIINYFNIINSPFVPPAK
ncbi:hypothetical protein IU501_23955 [Nocardia otitidiscaviarum]|uniref:DUF8020 domain-containing protein n=2 Tax=Nocardia otitidiscaviarum TaxID=1823 RepID=A0A516NU99_9NOCA|nr:hypothetical protein [Nocardia otitidiscaviarum]MBF6136051.1 hypothetical protein [Nocardia otitidiscaviarum]MBF6178907.1 hypothetical protein [Nocardia otitidiscaviarum]MBF6238097.1 hypothetical protein [Nocardia otitidiscaviarum]MBF6483808.1 hypothetical protein [Nocardia otitidiscaviarum]MCP9621804.1 hypothetical protein [Nocardia otitidiscaviarum]